MCVFFSANIVIWYNKLILYVDARLPGRRRFGASIQQRAARVLCTMRVEARSLKVYLYNVRRICFSPFSVFVQQTLQKLKLGRASIVETRITAAKKRESGLVKKTYRHAHT